MKRFFVAIVMLTLAVTVSAQSITRKGFYMDGDKAVNNNPKNSVTVCVTVERQVFTPGEFARYAQKMLGVRAMLAERKESKVLSAQIYTSEPTTPCQNSTTGGKQKVDLPSFRLDNRALSTDQQAQAAADMIFSMRRHRKELITGDAGENVFGAGLKAALEEMDAVEKQCLDLFYGTTVTTVEEHRFVITPVADEHKYLVCRYREGEGVLPVSDLSGEPLMLIFTPKAVDKSNLPFANDKDKVRREYTIFPLCSMELVLGTQTYDKGEIVVPQYSEKVVLGIR